MLPDINAYTGQLPFKQLKHNTCATLLGRINKFGFELV